MEEGKPCFVRHNLWIVAPNIDGNVREFKRSVRVLRHSVRAPTIRFPSNEAAVVDHFCNKEVIKSI